MYVMENEKPHMAMVGNVFNNVVGNSESRRHFILLKGYELCLKGRIIIQLNLYLKK